MRHASLALLTLLLLSACGEEDEPPTTADFGIADMSAYVEVQSNGNVAQISVSILGGGYGLPLGEGDALFWSEKGGPEQRLSLASQTYLGQLETGGVEFELVFQRGSERATSPLSLPASFAFIGPQGPVSRSSPIPVTWGPAATGTVETWVEVASDCLSYPILRYFSADVGVYEIQPADLAVKAGTSDCDLRVWLTRTATAGPSLPGFGLATQPGGKQIRSTSITTL